jgi:hypothetical protein
MNGHFLKSSFMISEKKFYRAFSLKHRAGNGHQVTVVKGIGENIPGILDNLRSIQTTGFSTFLKGDCYVE